LLGLDTDFVPKHAKRYATLADTIVAAVEKYADEVRCGAFPTEKESFVKRPAPEKDAEPAAV
jgi:3-methyl-2-oxobutanoate hydroxymethyltransferase